MKPRQEKILRYIIEEYIKNAVPVGSNALARKFNFKISSATLRIEMGELTDMGYLVQPHTSAGRIPTEKAYRFFIEKFCQPRLSSKVEKDFEEIFNEEGDDERMIREIGKLIALVSKNISILFFEDEVFWQGLSYLLSQPEFYKIDDILSVVETFESIFNSSFGELEDETKMSGNEIKIYIGEENPLRKDNDLALILGGIDNRGLVGILGPTRMDYQTNIALIKKTRELLGESL